MPPAIAAHLILGPREEPFLEAMLASIEPFVTTLIVNDNSPEPSPHAGALSASTFARDGRLALDRTPFTGFAGARNACLSVHARRNAGDWIAFVDADEVHGDLAVRIARNLERLPAAYDFVDAYTWHFFQSFDFYTSIERRMMFFRYRPGIAWSGAVHEQLQGLDGKRLVLPYVYAHYGHTLAPRRHAEKGRHYSSLGAPGEVLREDELDDFDVERYFAPEYPRLLRFAGTHPPAARATLQRLAPALRAHHELTERVAAGQPAAIRLRNLVRKLNYELRWRGRALGPSYGLTSAGVDS
ncbi:MAG TPA: glycosyltransferase [Verrucomicrobiae bacterium]|nr:glycosyltransferase [Verrucomicrobiae bacterium]